MIRQQGPLPFQQINREKVTSAMHEITSIIGYRTSSQIKASIGVGRFRVTAAGVRAMHGAVAEQTAIAECSASEKLKNEGINLGQKGAGEIRLG